MVDTQTDLTERMIELTKENESLKTQVKAYEDAAKTHTQDLATKDLEISRLNRLLVDNLLSTKDPNGTVDDGGKPDPMQMYAMTIKKLKA